jgi:hypothetical protein
LGDAAFLRDEDCAKVGWPFAEGLMATLLLHRCSLLAIKLAAT